LIQTPLHSANSCSLQIFPQKTKQRSTFDNQRKEIREELSSLASVSFLPELGSLEKLYKVLVFSGTRFCYVFPSKTGFSSGIFLEKKTLQSRLSFSQEFFCRFFLAFFLSYFLSNANTS
jgi:hypothetical protein